MLVKYIGFADIRVLNAKDLPEEDFHKTAFLRNQAVEVTPAVGKALLKKLGNEFVEVAEPEPEPEVEDLVPEPAEVKAPRNRTKGS